MTKQQKQKTAEARDPFKDSAFVATRANSMTAAATVRFAEVVGKQDPMALIDEMSALTKAVTDGDMREPERMLMGQAVALQAMFASLANRAALNMGKYPQTVERYMRLALKAQSQCRATIETLATLKSPPLVIAKQANVTSGPQQINNCMTAPSRARESENVQNKVLEDGNGQRLDTTASSTSGRADKAMEAVGTIDRPKNG